MNTTTTSQEANPTMRCTSCVLGNHTGSNGTAGCQGNCPCQADSDQGTRNLVAIVDHLGRFGFSRIDEADVAAYLTEADDVAGLDLYADDGDGAIVFFDSDGNVAATSTEGDFAELDAEQVAALSTDEVITWLIDAIR